eukprot:6300474-Prorocentrum_lima.AAC.1
MEERSLSMQARIGARLQEAEEHMEHAHQQVVLVLEEPATSHHNAFGEAEGGRVWSSTTREAGQCPL